MWFFSKTELEPHTYTSSLMLILMLIQLNWMPNKVYSFPKAHNSTEAICSPCRLIQLNWMTNKVYFFSKTDLERRTEAATPLRDGWGVTHNGSALVVSDGSASLHWLDPESLKLLHSVQVGSRVWGFRVWGLERSSRQQADKAPPATA